ncbi:hypothetical protein D3C71_2123800 [compost metagenome]
MQTQRRGQRHLTIQTAADPGGRRGGIFGLWQKVAIQHGLLLACQQHLRLLSGNQRDRRTALRISVDLPFRPVQ